MFNNIIDEHAPHRPTSRKEAVSFHKPLLNKSFVSIYLYKEYTKRNLATKNPTISAWCNFTDLKLLTAWRQSKITMIIILKLWK